MFKKLFSKIPALSQQNENSQAISFVEDVIFITPEDILAKDRKGWLCFGLLKRGSLALIFGAANAGKSFLTLQIAFGLATGRDAWGKPMEPGAVFYLTGGEGADGLRSRLEAWMEDQNFPTAKFPFFCVEEEIDLLSSAKVSNFIKSAKDD